MTIGERIREARKCAGLTQAQLAEQGGVAAISIHQYEAGKREPRIEQLQRIADALGVSGDYLLSGLMERNTTHLASGIHIYRSDLPFGSVASMLSDFQDASFDILYQDDYTVVVTDKDCSATREELAQIIKVFSRGLTEGLNSFKSKITNDANEELEDFATKSIVFNATPDPEYATLEKKLNDGTITQDELQRYKKLLAEGMANARKAVSEAKARLNTYMDLLNDEGQKKAMERVEELTEIPKYQRTPEPLPEDD